MYKKRTLGGTTNNEGLESITTTINVFEKLVANQRARIRELDEQVLAARAEMGVYEKKLVHLRAAQASDSGKVGTSTTFSPTKRIGRPPLSKPWTPTSRTLPRRRSARNVHAVPAMREVGAWQRDIENAMHTNEAPVTRKELQRKLQQQYPQFPAQRVYQAVAYAIQQGRILESNGRIALGAPKHATTETVA